MNQTKEPRPDHSPDFLLAEYSQLSEELRRVRAEGLSRLNFFITLTSTVLAGLIVLSQSNALTDVMVQIISLGALFFLTLLGWNTFRFTIARDINSDFNIRATARIRRYFIDKDPELAKYILWRIYDEPTKLTEKNGSNLRRTMETIMAITTALAGGIAVNLLVNSLYPAVMVGIVLLVVTYALLELFARNKFQKAHREARAERRFPYVAEQSGPQEPEANASLLS